MKRTAHIFTLVLLLIFGPNSADAFMDTVSAPETVEAGTPFSIAVFGNLSSPCWEVVNQRQIITEGVVTFDVFTAFTAPPGTSCPAVLVPYVVLEEMTIPTAGAWILRVIEHRYDPTGPDYPNEILEFDITATGTVAVEKISWGTLRARYR
jgi:hypothetical protein